MDEKDILICYLKEIHNFELYIKEEKGKLIGNHKEFFGYLINLEDYEKLKTKINYNENISKYKNYFSNPKDKNTTKRYTLDEIKFRDSTYLLNKIFNGNRYIIINIQLWKFLCKENQ